MLCVERTTVSRYPPEVRMWCRVKVQKLLISIMMHATMTA